jgi:hypothetical protein
LPSSLSVLFHIVAPHRCSNKVVVVVAVGIGVLLECGLDFCVVVRVVFLNVELVLELGSEARVLVGRASVSAQYACTRAA